jgi:hypothetical protein
MTLTRRLSVLISALTLAIAAPAAAQVHCGTVPVEGQRLLQQLADRHPALIRSQDDDARRAWVRMGAEQLAFSVSPEWGTKTAGGGRPQSKDAIARIVSGQLCGWDIVNGTTRALQFGEGEVLPGQAFVAVTPANHLGAPATEPQPDPTPDPAPGEAVTGITPEQLAAALAKLADLEAKLDAIALAAQNASNRAEAVVTASVEIRTLLREIQARPWPTYKATNRLIGTFTLTPQ